VLDLYCFYYVFVNQGGLPAWLLSDNDTMVVRTMNQS